MTSAISIQGVTRCFGNNMAMDNVSLEVSQGTVFGLLGVNGAGKTTLIRHVMGLLRPQKGTVRVFGQDPVADPVSVLSRIGYLSENHELPEWMKIHELLRYMQAFYPQWDETYAEELRMAFDLDAKAKIKQLSKGQRARAGLLCALAHRPALLVLDEPSSGLDPVVRKDILTAIIRTIAEEGRTVLFSSHLLHEVDHVADQVAMMDSGRITLCDSLSTIKEAHQWLIIQWPEPRSHPPAIPGALTWQGSGREWAGLCKASHPELSHGIAQCGGRIVDKRSATLEEIFVARAGAKPGVTEEIS